MAARRERRGAVENSNIVETEKSALEDVHALGIFPIDPPGEVKQKLVKYLFEESAIGNTPHPPLDFVNAPGSPGVYRGIHIAKSPFVSRQLTVRMHVPLAEKKDKLLLRIIRIYKRKRDTVESQVPRRIPGIFPFVGHGHDVIVVELRP